ncbi:MAG: hypothetical protein KDC51_02950 [Flavobacteriaceae bacterium]|nr:hypothetical protein [Flavobacteriaceae bacterium]
MKKLDSNTKFIKSFNYGAIGLLGIFLSYIFLKANFMLFISASLGIGILIILLIKKTNQKTPDLYFDSDYLHLKNKNASEKIKLDRINGIEHTSTRIKILGFPYYKYLIDYIDPYGTNRTIKFWKRGNDETFEEFKETVKNSKSYHIQ